MTPPYTPPYSGTTTLDCYEEVTGHLYGSAFLDARLAVGDPAPGSGNPCPISNVLGEPWMEEICVYRPSEEEPGTYWLRSEVNLRFSSPYGDVTGQTYARGLDAEGAPTEA
jgi:hypothetical protein